MFASQTTRWLICLGGAAVFALATGSSAWAWVWPADGAVLRGFSVSGDAYAGGQHRGVDIALGGALAFRAPVSGTVTFAGSLPVNGLTVTIATGEYKATLTHLGELRVRRGQTVSEGDVLAEPGPTGEQEHPVPYVHLGVRVGAAETYVDPLGLLPPRGASSPPPAPEAPPAPEPPAAPGPPAAASAPAPSPPVAPADPAPVQPQPPTSADVPDETLDPDSGSAPSESTTGITIGASTRVTSSLRRSAHARSIVTRLAAAPSAPSAAAPQTPARAEPETTWAGTAEATTSRAARVRHRADRIDPFHASPARLALGGRRTKRGPEAEAGRAISGRRAVALLALLLGLAGGAAAGALRVTRKRLPIIGAHVGDLEAEEDPGSGSLAVRQWAPSHRPRGGVRSPVRHLCALPPTPWQQRAHGQRDRRARDAGHGRGGRRRRVTA